MDFLSVNGHPPAFRVIGINEHGDSNGDGILQRVLPGLSRRSRTGSFSGDYQCLPKRSLGLGAAIAGGARLGRPVQICRRQVVHQAKQRSLAGLRAADDMGIHRIAGNGNDRVSIGSMEYACLTARCFGRNKV